ncbi:MAG: GNAT family N-acetyltransferase [Anaerolineae bacterium]|nr:GNAT family N-acetyltransferase [Anaerolineae bacterium]
MADSYPIFIVFEETLADLIQRFGSAGPTSWQDPAALEQMWQERRSMYEHLARTAAHFWVAERAGQIVGFARSIRRDDVLELTEFFVRPGEQAVGVGRELLARAFPTDGAKRRIIIASLDLRAQARYLKAGVYPHFPVYYFGRTPEITTIPTNLTIEPITVSPKYLEILAVLDQTLLNYRRDADHTWLLSDRQGFLYYRDGQPVGYGYVGSRSGPFALLHPHDFPAVLAHAENLVVAAGRPHFGLEVPMINRTAVAYLLARNFQMDAFMAVLMNDVSFGRFEHYIFTSPPFFL